MNSPWNRLLRLLALIVVVQAATVATAENWPQWRGPRADGTSQETSLSTTWSNTEGVVWRTELPGPAGATPIVWEDRIFLTSADGQDLVLLAFDGDGSPLWRRTVSTGNRDVRGDEGNSASPSPFTDGQHVWTYMANGAFACYDFAGEERYRFDLQDRFGKFEIQFGMTSTPILDGDHVYCQLIHSGGAKIVALDKSTGDTRWVHERASDAYAECEHSYASPVLYRDARQAFLISHGADYVMAHRLDDGGEIWRCGGLNPRGNYNPTLRFVASPLAVPGLIVVPSAKNGPVLGLRPDLAGHVLAGDVTESPAAYLWTRTQNTPDVPSPLIHDGVLYLCRENGVLIAMDAETGEELYQERTHSDRHRASPIYADGKVYLSSRDGTVSVVRAGRRFELLASNKMQEQISASPAISNGRIYLRTFDALYAIGER